MIQRINVRQIEPTSNTYISFSDQINGMSVPYQQVTIATEGQTDIFLKDNVIYKMGVKQPIIFLNGQFVESGINNAYIEVNETLIRFNDPLFEGDEIVLRLEGTGGGTTGKTYGRITNQVPNGLINGVNKTFSLNHIPLEGSLVVNINGVRQTENTYTTLNNLFTLDLAPRTGFQVLVDYNL